MLVNLDNDSRWDLPEDEDFASEFKNYDKQGNDGGVQECEIVAFNNDFAIIAVPNQKQESFLPISEIKDKDGNLLFKQGDKIEVFVSSVGGRSRVSYKKVLKHKKLLEKIDELVANFEGKVIEGKVISKNGGGFILEYDDIDVFLPHSESAIKDITKALNKTYKVVITKVNKEKKSIIVSRKKFFEIDDNNKKEVAKKLLENNEVQQGVVSRIESFGVFVEVNDIEGLVHYTELSHRGPINANKKYKIGEQVQVKVLGYDEQKKRLILSFKATENDPWQEIEKELEVGYALKAIVSNIESYGAFVDLGNNIEGFLHISEISWDKHINNPKDYLSVGDEIDVEIIEIDKVHRKLRVSQKKLLDKPFNVFVKKYKVGDDIVAKVNTITDFGAFLRIDGVDGLLHNEDASWDKESKCRNLFKVGDEIRVRIEKIDAENERVSLSHKVFTTSPAATFAKKHQVDDVVNGSITEIKDFGVFVAIDNIEALISNEDLHPKRIDELKVGDSIECVIVSINEVHNKIRASIKRLERQKEKENLKAYSNDEKMTLGDKIKNRL